MTSFKTLDSFLQLAGGHLNTRTTRHALEHIFEKISLLYIGASVSLVNQVLLLLTQRKAYFENAFIQQSIAQVAFIHLLVIVLIKVFGLLVDLIARQQFLKIKGDRTVFDKDDCFKF